MRKRCGPLSPPTGRIGPAFFLFCPPRPEPENQRCAALYWIIFRICCTRYPTRPDSRAKGSRTGSIIILSPKTNLKRELIGGGGLNGRRSTTITTVLPQITWTGDGYDEIFIADARGVFDRHGTRIATLATGVRGLSLLLGDMTGDGVSDMTVVTGTPPAVHIFKNEKGRKSAKPVPLGCGVNHTLY